MPNPIETPPIEFKASGNVSANATYVAFFGQAIGDSSINGGIAKHDKSIGNVHSTNDQFIALDDEAVIETEEGWHVQKDLNLITRSVAASELSKAMGIDCLAEEAYGQDDEGRAVGVSAFVNGSPMTLDKEDRVTTFAHNLENPVIQRGLYDLEAFDYLVGQVDRHEGNIFIEADTRKVRGIDNDLCFGEKKLEQAVINAVQQKAVGRPPNRFHPDTAKKIETLTPARLKEILSAASDPQGGHRLNEREINNAVERLGILKVAVQKARSVGHVTEQQFNGGPLLLKELQRQKECTLSPHGDPDKTTSYLGRAAEKQERVRQSIGIAVAAGASPEELKIQFVRLPPAAQPTPAQQRLVEARQELANAKAEALASKQQDKMARAERKLEKCEAKIAAALNKLATEQLDTRLADRQELCNVAAVALQYGQNDTMKPLQQAAVAKLTGWTYDQGTKRLSDAQGKDLTNKEIQDQSKRFKAEALELGKQIAANEVVVSETLAHLITELDRAASVLKGRKAQLDDLVNGDPRVRVAAQNVAQASRAPEWAREVHQRLAPPVLETAFIKADKTIRPNAPRMVMGHTKYPQATEGEIPISRNSTSSSSNDHSRSGNDHGDFEPELEGFHQDNDSQRDSLHVPVSEIDPAFEIKANELESLSIEDLQGELHRLNTQHADSAGRQAAVNAVARVLDAKLNAQPFQPKIVPSQAPVQTPPEVAPRPKVGATWRTAPAGDSNARVKQFLGARTVEASLHPTSPVANHGAGPLNSALLPRSSPIPAPVPSPAAPATGQTPVAVPVAANNTNTLKNQLQGQLGVLQTPEQRQAALNKRGGGGGAHHLGGGNG